MLVENFSLLDEWEDRYRYLIELGKNLPAMEESLKTPASLVNGCTSQVWLVSIPMDSSEVPLRYHFIADSDSHIVRGLIALVLAAYDGKTADEIAAVEVEDFFSRLGLDDHLSPNRRSGFFAMVSRIRSLAAGGSGNRSR